MLGMAPPPSARALPAALPAALPSQSLRSPCSEAFDFVYLVCNELSGDSTIIALKPEDGSPAWTLSTSSLASALVPVRAAAARDGVFYYSDTGSNITALRSEDGALLWRLDVAALVPSTLNGASVTHLLLTDDVLLIRWGATLAGVLGVAAPLVWACICPGTGRNPPSLAARSKAPCLTLTPPCPACLQGVLGRPVLLRRPLLLPGAAAEPHCGQPPLPAVGGRLA